MEDALVISPWAFLSRPRTYLRKINEGIKVLVCSRRNTYSVERIKDPYKMTKKEFFAKLDRGIQDWEDGKNITKTRSKEEMRAFLDSL
jgi:hypothetical protein